MPVTVDEARNYLEVVRESDRALSGLADKWDQISGKANESADAHSRINGKIQEQNGLSAEQKKILGDSLAVTNALLDEFAKFAPETKEWTDALSGVLNTVVRFASGDIVGGIVAAIQTVGDAIFDLLGLGDRWEEQLDAVDDVYDRIGLAVEKFWTIMDKKIRAGKMTLEEELSILKMQQQNEGVMKLTEEQRLDLAIKIKATEEKLYRQSVEKEKELSAIREARRKSELDELRRKIDLGLIDVQNIGEAGALAGRLHGLDYSGTELASELQKLGAGRGAFSGAIHITQTNFGLTGAQAGEQIARQISSATGGN